MAFETETVDEHTEPLSLRDELTAAMGVEPSPAQTIAPSDPPAAAEPSSTPVRGPDGKFAKADSQLPPEPTAQPTPEPQPETIRPPASWSATAKADFAKLAPHIQTEVLKRESEIEAGKAQWDQKAQRFNRLDAILSPRQERFKLAGLDETQAIQALFAAQDMLERDPVNALQYLARQSGVDLRSLFANTQQQPQAQLPPVVQEMRNEIATLKQQLSQQSQAADQQVQSETQSRIDAFAADPVHVYFANVRGDMAALMRAGQATSLQDAYDKAIWANPEIRPLLLRDQQLQAQTQLEQQAREKAQAARRASGSVTGSPTPGSSPAAGAPAPSIREELARQFSSSV